MSDPADRVVLSYRIHGSGNESWVREALSEDTYVGYLRRVHEGDVTVGEEWEEFVSRGCGMPVDLTLRVESVEGDPRLGQETELAFERAAD